MHSPLAKMAQAEGPSNFNSTLSVWLATICYLILTTSLFWSSPSYSLLIIPSIIFTFINIAFTSLMLDQDNVIKDPIDELIPGLKKSYAHDEVADGIKRLAKHQK